MFATLQEPVRPSLRVSPFLLGGFLLAGLRSLLLSVLFLMIALLYHTYVTIARFLADE
jgi:hypothetical protein